MKKTVEQTQAVARFAYILKRKRQKNMFQTVIFAAAAFFVLGCGLLVYRTITLNQLYFAKTHIANGTAYEEKIQSYKDAIELLPERVDAYLLLLEAYEEEGVFDLPQSGEFTAIYNAHTEVQKSEGVFQLNYRAGKMYFNLYTENGEPVSMSTKVQKSYYYFSSNHDLLSTTRDANKLDSAEKILSECYYNVCAFYKNYIFNTTDVRELSPEVMTDLVKTISDALQASSRLSEYDRLLLYSSVCNLLFDQRENLRWADEATVLGILDDLNADVSSMQPTSDTTIDLRTRFLSAFDSCYDAIARALQGKEAPP